MRSLIKKLTVKKDPVLRVNKPAFEAIASSTTLQDDDDLTVIVAPLATYKFDALIRVLSASSTPDIKLKWTATDGAYDFVIIDWNASSAPSSLTSMNEADTEVFVLGAGVGKFILFQGVYTSGAAGGEFKLQWAQNVSDATATSVREDSWMRLEPMNKYG